MTARMTARLTRVLAIGALALPAPLSAHEGHEHTLMGTVQAIGEKTLEVKVRDEKAKTDQVLTVVLTEKTEVLRGDRPATIGDIQVGERIVVRAVMTKDPKGRDVYTARRLQVAARPARSSW